MEDKLLMLEVDDAICFIGSRKVVKIIWNCVFFLLITHQEKEASLLCFQVLSMHVIIFASNL
jgi:hypothetical protein